MVSVHHVVHSLCVVLIAFLLKKFLELRSIHAELRLDHDRLKQACRAAVPGSDTSTNRQPALCHCPCQSSRHLRQSQTGFQTQFHAFPENEGQSGLAATQQILAHGPDSIDVVDDVSHVTDDGVEDFSRTVSHVTDDGVEDFGRTVSSHVTDDGVEDFGRTVSSHVTDDGVEDFGRTVSSHDVQEDAASTDFKHTAQLPPTNYIPSVQPSVIAPDVRVYEHAKASQPLDTVTDSQTLISFQKTSESLESVTLSPSSDFPFSDLSLRTEDSPASSVEDSSSETHCNDDFYLRSCSREKDGEDEADVIVTSVSDTDSHGKAVFSERSHTLQTAFSKNGDDEYFEEWEEEDGEEEIEEEEEEPHPAFGNVELQELSQQEVDRLSVDGSSVQCTGQSVSDRMCRFSYLCFQPATRRFVFLLGPRSVKDNAPTLGGQDALLELSSVTGHNAQHLSLLTLQASSIRHRRVVLVTGTTVVFRRFKPDNIMHVLHDDIIPLFHTLVSQNFQPELFPGGRKFPVSLFLSDENSEGEHYGLYAALAGGATFTSNSLVTSVAGRAGAEGLVCFPQAQVGLSKTTTWYQYGFFEPQGPLVGSAAGSHHIHSVSSFLLAGFAKDCPLCAHRGHLVLVSRKETRRILNEMELVMAISKAFRVKVMTVSLDTHSVADILAVIHTSLGIIGMHGSLLSLAGFLQQGSVVVELFPYAVNPQHYTPYRTLALLPGMLLAYRAWANQDRDSSVMHPDWSKEFGGLGHLSLEQQQEIISQREVPRHLCCEDPSWLFHIFQDTHVHIPQVLSLVSAALEEARPWRFISGNSNTPLSSALLPGPPGTLTCSDQRSGDRRSVVLQWTRPWNGHLFGGQSITYRIQVQDALSGRVVATNTCRVLHFAVTEGLSPNTDYRVWVSCVVSGMQGPFAAVDSCSTI